MGEAAESLRSSRPGRLRSLASRRDVVGGVAQLVAGLLAAFLCGLAFGWQLGPPIAFGTFAALEGLAAFTAAWLARRFRIVLWLLDGAFVAAALLLLPPLGTVVAMGAGMLIGLLLGGRPGPRAIGTGGVILVSTSVAVAVFDGLRPGGDIASAHAGAAVVFAVVLMTVASEVVVSLNYAFLGTEPFVAGIVGALKFSLPRAPFIASLGLVAGLAGQLSPVAPLFALPPMGAMIYVLAEHFRAERDRHRAETLFRTAEAAHASMDLDDVATAVARAAQSLLTAEHAELRPTPPADGEIGVRLDTSDEQWLVVRGVADDADSVLPAVAAVGASALENARLAEQLRHQAVHDSLTGLPNQVLLADRVMQAIAVDSRRRFVLMVLDLDAFRKVNDSLGHSAGDDLLRELGRRLTASVRPGDTVARLSSDVFVLLLPHVDTAELAGVMTEKLLAAISRPIQLGAQEVFMTACAGLAFFPDDGQEAGHLLRNADSALHRAKAAGPGSYEIYAQGMNELAHQRLARESELHQAVRRDELRVRYQPQIDLRTGKLIGVEALVRWDHPMLGILAPNEFVPLAEESGLIVEVDSWVLRKTCEQASAWLTDGLTPVRVAVNLSARHFQSPERLIGTIRDTLADSGLHPSLLELEVTEGLAVVEDRSAEILQRVRDLGVSISIDDFGTGYSMLGRLHRFPVDRLKIDRSFVREIVSSQSEAPIVSAIIAMARSLGIETVAEGIETLEQQMYLRNRSCDLGQGFLFSHPTEADDIARMLRADSVGLNLSPLS